MTKTQNIKVVILISGSGSNLQTLIDQSLAGTLPIEIVAVISNTPNAYGLTRAKKAGIHTQVFINAFLKLQVVA